MNVVLLILICWEKTSIAWDQRNPNIVASITRMVQPISGYKGRMISESSICQEKLASTTTHLWTSSAYMYLQSMQVTKFPPKVKSLMSSMNFWTKRRWFPFNPPPLILELIIVFICRQNVTTISVTTVGAAERCHNSFLFSMQENALEN